MSRVTFWDCLDYLFQESLALHSGDVLTPFKLFLLIVIFFSVFSTLSANLNTLAGTIYEDFFEPHISKETSEKRAGTIMKLMVVVIGCFCLALVLVIERLGGVLDISLSFHGMTAGPLLGLFTLGMLFRSANSKVTQTFFKMF